MYGIPVGVPHQYLDGIYIVNANINSGHVLVCFMWFGNGRIMRISQPTYVSPAWLFCNIVNFSLGDIISEVFNMVSSFVAIIR